MLSTDKIVRQQGAFQFDGEGGEAFGYPDERLSGGGMEQGGSTSGENHCTVWNSQKSGGRASAVAACRADLCRVVSDS